MSLWISIFLVFLFIFNQDRVEIKVKIQVYLIDLDFYMQFINAIIKLNCWQWYKITTNAMKCQESLKSWVKTRVGIARNLAKSLQTFITHAHYQTANTDWLIVYSTTKALASNSCLPGLTQPWGGGWYDLEQRTARNQRKISIWTLWWTHRGGPSGRDVCVQGMSGAQTGPSEGEHRKGSAVINCVSPFIFLLIHCMPLTFTFVLCPRHCPLSPSIPPPLPLPLSVSLITNISLCYL